MEEENVSYMLCVSWAAEPRSIPKDWRGNMLGGGATRHMAAVVVFS